VDGLLSIDKLARRLINSLIDEQRTTLRESNETSESDIFNFDLLSDDQIAIISRALLAEYEIEKQNARQAQKERSDQTESAEELLDLLQAGIRNIALSDPDRIRNLLVLLSQSGNRYDRETAAECVDCLLDYDYAFVRDVLIHLYADEGIADDTGVVNETAMTKIRHLMNERLTAEQTEDFNSRIAEYDKRLQL
jgi:hypothetical protein